LLIAACSGDARPPEKPSTQKFHSFVLNNTELLVPESAFNWGPSRNSPAETPGDVWQLSLKVPAREGVKTESAGLILEFESLGDDWLTYGITSCRNCKLERRAFEHPAERGVYGMVCKYGPAQKPLSGWQIHESACEGQMDLSKLTSPYIAHSAYVRTHSTLYVKYHQEHGHVVSYVKCAARPPDWTPGHRSMRRFLPCEHQFQAIGLSAIVDMRWNGEHLDKRDQFESLVQTQVHSFIQR
jgi:hypothetical protein